MPKVQLNEQKYQDARRRAADGGYASVDEYVADLISKDVADGADGFDHLFTAELLAHLDKISKKIKAGGRTYTLAELRGLFERKFQE